MYPYSVMVAQQPPNLFVGVQALVRVPSGSAGNKDKKGIIAPASARVCWFEADSQFLPKCRYRTMEVRDIANVEMRVQFSLLAPNMHK